MTIGRILSIGASLSVCVLALWSLLYVFVLSSVQHARSQHELYAQLRAQLALATAPIGGTIAAGTPVAVISSPTAGLRGEVIVEGTSSGALRLGPGHLRTSPLPGQPGISVVYGRALAFGGPFAGIVRLHPGDPITVTTDQGVFHFAVTGVRRGGDQLVVPPAGSSTLTLVTSEGGWVPRGVVYVDARLSGKPVPDPGGRPTELAPQEKLLAGEHDPLTLVQIVLWLQLLLVVSCGLVWLHARWTRWQLWLVGAPLLLATVWGLSNTAIRMLPNVM
jgi:sortase A